MKGTITVFNVKSQSRKGNLQPSNKQPRTDLEYHEGSGQSLQAEQVVPISTNLNLAIIGINNICKMWRAQDFEGRGAPRPKLWFKKNYALPVSVLFSMTNTDSFGIEMVFN